ncbi:MAG: amidohydrolase [Candidatus Fermentithermobacillus carboniphilus]|uniref:Amidohydrolase n=1 Tax=Candidatus Fermentithermobacillus carboniphilus TaxID=3085328 RepID=A0AAT9LE49_9FIRM|nr:MAG: amidohydrolase [Candidatus Fermentithermobacillus carboniphilus]
MTRPDPSTILERARSLQGQIISWRREIHQYPELGLETPKTAGLVARVLSALDIEVREKVGGWGVVGLLRGSRNGGAAQEDRDRSRGGPLGSEKPAERTIALRADMDALPVQEETGLPYASKIPGRMHACGHDGHVAMLLGAATLLSEMRDKFRGNVKFIFQPGEEGAGGARLMIEDGALENPKVDMILGAHLGVLWPIKSGQVGTRTGPTMAASDRFTITVHGKGGHGATPHLTVDPIVVASEIVLALQTIVSREVSPVAPAVLTVGVIEAGTANNVIPEDCVMKGTVRYLDKRLAEFIPRRIEEISMGIARAMRAEVEVDYRYGYPPVVNDPAVTEFLRKSAASIVGPENVVVLDEPTMGGEDMAYYLERVPGTFFAIGSGTPENGTAYPHHHPKFNIDEGVLHLGAAVFAEACLEFLCD